ncbi:MAG: DUF805 domain-containing protein [Gammaproteobacteria bacterium]|nr:DUF805 domain-containing protein [Gammaproteobacteria bacterium]MDH3859131.1 DUF805 domain-containing protein [Gammaproteobacteria bacterium]
MSAVNPYDAPDALLDTGQEELYQPKIFSFNGRIGRMRYLAYGIGVNLLLMLVMVPLAGATAFMGGDPSSSMIGILGIGIFYVLTIVISVMFAKRRLNDLNRSGWWFLLFIVPFVNLLLAIYLIFFPGTNGSNNFGPAPEANSVGVLILGWLMPVFFILGIVAAIAVPAYQDYLSRVQ